MTDRFIQLLTIVTLSAISIGVGVSITKRNVSSLGRNANLITETNRNYSDDCIDDTNINDDDSILRRRLVKKMPPRSIRANVEAEWPWQDDLMRQLTFSMEFSMSVSGKSGKILKGSGKSTVRLLVFVLLFHSMLIYFRNNNIKTV